MCHFIALISGVIPIIYFFFYYISLSDHNIKIKLLSIGTHLTPNKWNPLQRNNTYRQIVSWCRWFGLIFFLLWPGSSACYCYWNPVQTKYIHLLHLCQRCGISKETLLFTTFTWSHNWISSLWTMTATKIYDHMIYYITRNADHIGLAAYSAFNWSWLTEYGKTKNGKFKRQELTSIHLVFGVFVRGLATLKKEKLHELLCAHWTLKWERFRIAVQMYKSVNLREKYFPCWHLSLRYGRNAIWHVNCVFPREKKNIPGIRL